MARRRVLWVADKLGYGEELHDVGRWYVSMHQAFEHQASESNGVEVVAIVLRASPSLVHPLAEKGMVVRTLGMARLDPRTLFALTNLIRRERIDVVHAHGYGASAFARLAGRLTHVPVIVHQHDSLAEGPWYARLCDRLMAPWTASTLAVSEAVREFCAHERSLSAAPIEVWHPAVASPAQAIDAPRRAAAKKALGIPTGHVVVGSVARLVPEKGVRCLVEAMPRVLAARPDTTFVIVGDGPERPALEAAATRLGVDASIRWLGYQHDVQPALAAMDCFVSTSVVDGAPLAVFEAMASGTAIVATAVSGTLDVLKHEANALLVPSRDPRALAEALAKLVQDAGLRERLARQAASDSRAYDAAQYAEKLTALYERVTSNGAAPRPKAVSPLKRFETLFRYLAVGASGATVHLGTLWALVELAGLPVLVATTTGFVLAVISNFILNRLWTFRSQERNVRLQFVRFWIVALWGMGINTGLMWVLVHLLMMRYLIAQVLTIGIVSMWNFFANTYWTFQPIRFGAPASARKAYLYDVSVVIPALNEENRLPATLSGMGPYFRSRGLRAEVIVVDDGSTDRTLEMLTQLSDDGATLRLIHNPVNRGKGAAVRAGFRAAQGEYVLMMDADNATPVESLDALWPHRQVQRILIGSRHAGGWRRRPGVPWLRYAISRIGNGMIQWLLLPGVHDTQCGFKLFSYPVAKALAVRQRINRFGFDMELLAIARALGIEMQEIEVPWTAIPGSRVRPMRDAWRVFGELMTIKTNLMTGAYHIEHAVGLSPAEALAAEERR